MALSPVESERPPSPRVALARLAAAVLVAEPTVVPTAGLGRWATSDGSGRIDGVVAAEGADGTVEVELHLSARWPTGSLPRLAEDLREEVREAARRTGLGGRLGEVAVSIHDIDFGDEEAVR